MAAGLPCDSPEHRAIASEYPTYKLDQNTVVDNSISWERCNPDGTVNVNGVNTTAGSGTPGLGSTSFSQITSKRLV